MPEKRRRKKGHNSIPKYIMIIARTLQFVSPRLAAWFATKLFTTPLRYKLPKREIQMDAGSKQCMVSVPVIDKKIMTYTYGEGNPKILLVHGWSGRGTQLVKFAEALREKGFSTLSFDAPAHGKSPGSRTLMPEFVACIHQLEKECGPFHAAIGHSLGGMSLLNAVAEGLRIRKLVIIGSGDIIEEITLDFVRQLKLKPVVAEIMIRNFEQDSQKAMHGYSSYMAAQKVQIPVLVVHDENDQEVLIKNAHHIASHLSDAELFLTKGLGHRKILGNVSVIDKVISHIVEP